MGRLFWKIFFAFWLTLVAAAAATGTAVWLQHQRRPGAEELALGPGAMLTTDLASATLRHGGVEALRDWMKETQRARGLPLLAVDLDGKDLLGRPVPAHALTRARELAVSEESPRAAREVSARSGEHYLLFTPLDGEARRLRRPPPTPPPWELALIVGAASFAVSALLAWYLARPIRTLRWAFDAAAEGRLDTRVRPLMKARRDEIADLGDDFDRMAEQLQKLVAAQRRLLHDVSHELRSPLARLQAAVGLARQSPAKLEASLDRMERELTRLAELVGEALTLSRLESGTRDARTETVDLADLVADVAQDARFEAEAANRRLSLRSVDRLLVCGDAELLHRAVENVVRNAVKYTPEGTDVALELYMAGERSVLVVSDRGPGIPPEELERVFEPFYRISNDTVKGFGLGLAIARRAILAHGGSIRAHNREGGGLRVEIELQLASAP